MILPPWALKIKVEKVENELLVYGTGMHLGPQHREYSHPSMPDLLRNFDPVRRPPKRRKVVDAPALARVTPRSQSRNSLHLLFASADTLEKQIQFVLDFGPVLASDVENPIEETYEPGEECLDIIAHQNLTVLNAEQKLYARITHLTGLVSALSPWAIKASEREKEYNQRHPPLRECEAFHYDRKSYQLGAKTFDSFLARDGLLTSTQKDQVQVMRQLILEIRELQDSYPKNALWKFDDSVSWSEQIICPYFKDWIEDGCSLSIFRIANDLLCRVFNLFPASLYQSGANVLEMPTVTPTGIRSAIYSMLRMEFLQKGLIKRCAKQDCGRYFVPDRSDGRCCSHSCKNSANVQLCRDRKKLADKKKDATKLSKRRVAH
jgi:hypothetical protein